MYNINTDRLYSDTSYLKEIISNVSESVKPDKEISKIRLSENVKIHNKNINDLEKINNKYNQNEHFIMFRHNINEMELCVDAFDERAFSYNGQAGCQRMWKVVYDKDNNRSIELIPNYVNQIMKIIKEAKDQIKEAKNIFGSVNRNPICMDGTKPIVIWFDKKTKRFYIVDGSHTVLLCLMFGINVPAWKEVIADSYEEALFFAFLNQNRGTTSINGATTMIVKAIDKDEIAKAIIHTIINTEGYALEGYNSKHDTIVRCVEHIHKLIEKVDHITINSFETALSVCREAKGNRKFSINKEIIEMLMYNAGYMNLNIEARTVIVEMLRRNPTIKGLKKEASEYYKEHQFDYGDGKSGSGIVIGYGKALIEDAIRSSK